MLIQGHICLLLGVLIISFVGYLFFQSPDGCTVASAAGDETLRFWNVFGTPEVAKPAAKSNPEPFAHLSRIR